MKIYIWDNDEAGEDRALWFVESDLDPDIIEPILDAAVDRRSRSGGVVAVVDSKSVRWRQHRVTSFADWFTCYGDELINWRDRAVHETLSRLPLSEARALSYRLYPENASIMAECLGFEV